MRTKKLLKKLVISKTTVANLNNMEMRFVYAGNEGTIYTACENTNEPVSCDLTQISDCYTYGITICEDNCETLFLTLPCCA